MMLGTALILIKSPKDILQGISKFDYLYKVSSLQVYKKQEFQNMPKELSYSITEDILENQSINREQM